MGFRFRKSFKAGPFRVNLSKSGVGWSVGGPGFRYTRTANGRRRKTYSIPGTGLSYVSESGKKRANAGSRKKPSAGAGAPAAAQHPSYPERPIRKSDNFTKPQIVLILCGACWIGIILAVVIAQIVTGGNAIVFSSSEASSYSQAVFASSEASTDVENVSSSVSLPPVVTPEDSMPESVAIYVPFAPSSTPTEQVPASSEQQVMVWVPTKGGTKYHRRSGCSGMEDPVQVTLDEAKAMGFEPCGKCY